MPQLIPRRRLSQSLENSKMEFIKNQRVILVALISAKKTIETELEKIKAKINFDKGKVVGEIIQRRGVSRDKRPGGSKRMDLPMNPTTFIGKGKVDEIKTLCKETQADGVIFLNPLNSTQINNVESEIDCWVKVWKIK
ncbi:MAG: hypothetical protein DRH26_15685 [Deltaproteobacteria bacterium]|nr:MAG: hypothetical protein DRH26_15685 [Deltaproteobacteria bacterium]